MKRYQAIATALRQGEDPRDLLPDQIIMTSGTFSNRLEFASSCEGVDFVVTVQPDLVEGFTLGYSHAYADGEAFDRIQAHVRHTFTEWLNQEVTEAVSNLEAHKRGWEEGETCSVRCLHCAERCWFMGNLEDAPMVFACPECDRLTFNRFSNEALLR